MGEHTVKGGCEIVRLREWASRKRTCKTMREGVGWLANWRGVSRLFVAQGYQRVDIKSATRGDVAGQQGDARQSEGDERVVDAFA